MTKGRSRGLVEFGFSLCLLTAVAAPLASAQPMKLRNAEAQPLTFAALDGWSSDDQSAAFETYLKSCSAILHGTEAMRKARPVYSGLYNACIKAVALASGGKVDTIAARKFFENNFKPVRILPAMHTYGYYTGADGFYTGYFEPEVAGSRVKTAEYTVPLYGVPAKLAGKTSTVFAQYDRVDIEKGALAGRDLEICWVKNPVDAFFAQIQGSTRVRFDDGKLLRLNYIASNGKPYTPVGRILIDDGVFTPQEMSMDKIRDFMEANPELGKALRDKNRSYVFFSKTTLQPHDECLGAQGIQLTPGRSIAVDPGIHVYGTPVWIDARFPLKSDAPQDVFQRLMVAQDTGSAIRGPARADIYFGHGPEIPSIAGRIKQFGKFVMLVPKDVTVKADVAMARDVPGAVPVPKPRPKAIVADVKP
ncbi:MAG: transglycosylase [Rhodopseudomonas sp.]|nr:transglycosylase [Rhodopseudomonas sp.]